MSGIRRCTQSGNTAMVPAGVEKSITASRRVSSDSLDRIGTPSLPMPATSPASLPWSGCCAASRAAPIVRFLSSYASCRMRCPMRPQAPLTPMMVFISGVNLNGFDDFVQIVRHLHGPVRIGRATDTAFAEHLIEGLLISAMIRDRGRWVLELMPRQNAYDALARLDNALMP